MTRIGRIVIPRFPHHVTQRGNRRQQVFFEPADYALYRDLLARDGIGVCKCLLCGQTGHGTGSPSISVSLP